MRRVWLGLVGCFGALSIGALACGSDAIIRVTPDAQTGDETAVDTSAPDSSVPLCTAQGLTALAFNAGPYGTHRGDVSDDFALPLMDGTSWSFNANFTGCESYVFLPDNLAISQIDPTPLWNSDADLAALVKQSPKNAHYFFVSLRKDPTAAAANLAAMQDRITKLKATLSDADQSQWSTHLHVVATHAQELAAWMGAPMTTYLIGGFAIDRLQKIRGVGNLADVKRYDKNLANQNMWPWKGNLAMTVNEVIYMNAEADESARLSAETATVVELFKGETLSQFKETDVLLPSAQDMAKFDTLEIEITQMCPDPSKAEQDNNCGAWDYIASLSLAQPLSDGGMVDGGPVMQSTEVARFITSYHRETHWVVDATETLPLLKAGGMQHFRWDFAPPWNVQPTATKLSLRFSNQKKGLTPVQATPLFAGGSFDSKYDVRSPVSVPIAQGAKKVELWAIITGHGSGNNNCAEFCNHHHDFTVNGTVFSKEYPMAGNDTGCIVAEKGGMTPNQGGTWWFGRGGWCPGAPVQPWVTDVTKSVTPGQTATVTYQGLFGGTPPSDGTGNIDMSSWLVVYQ